jgi:hypothetical protein
MNMTNALATQEALYDAEGVPVFNDPNTLSAACAGPPALSAVLLTSEVQIVDARLEYGRDNQRLQQLVGHLAASGETVGLPAVARNGLKVTPEDAENALFEHLGNTGQLLLPTAVLALAAALKIARQQSDAGLVLAVHNDTLAADPIKQRYFMARVSRRQMDLRFHRPVTSWPARFTLEATQAT